MDKIYKKILNGVASFKQYWKGQPVVDYGIVTPTPPGPDYTEPFYVENITGNNEKLRIVKSNANAPTITIEISTDRINWSTLGTTDTKAITRTITPGEKLYMRASTYRWGSGSINYHRITGVSKVGGNIMSLLYGSNFTGEETVFPSQSYNNTFTHLFSGTGFTPNGILQDASCLLLPIKEKLPNNCYSYMFQYCESLTVAPELPAKTLASQCYYRMFSECYSLTTAPELPAKTLVSQCYSGMFEYCESLNSIKCLATDISAKSCLAGWTAGVSAKGTFIKDANMFDWPTGESGIPSRWKVQDA